jgi:hypothetical protein
MTAKPRPDETTRRRPHQASWRLSKVSQLTREDDVRVSRAFSRLLRLEGIWVRRVQFFSDRIVVVVALRRRRLVCPLCSFSTPHRHNRQSVDSTWRHLDLGIWRLELRAQLRRLACPEHGVRVEGVPFARHGSGFTRDFEALVAWLASTMDKSAITRLVRIDWDTVGRIISRVCADELDPDRLENLFEIGIERGQLEAPAQLPHAGRRPHPRPDRVGHHRQRQRRGQPVLPPARQEPLARDRGDLVGHGPRGTRSPRASTRRRRPSRSTRSTS